MSLVGSTLSNGEMVDGGTDHLRRCLCEEGGLGVTMPGSCQASCDQLLEEITGPVFSSLASWLETSGDGVCSFSGSGILQISSALVTIMTLFNILR